MRIQDMDHRSTTKNSYGGFHMQGPVTINVSISLCSIGFFFLIEKNE